MNRFKTYFIYLLIGGLLLSVVGRLIFSCDDKPAGKGHETPVAPPAKVVPTIAYSLVKSYPHDTTAFTEGFLFHDKKLLESTGAPKYLPQARSALGVSDLEKGKLEIKAEIDKNEFFGEGIVVLNNKIFQVTLENQKGFIYDASTYKQIGQFNYQNKQGWGLTTDGKHIIMSDGTYNLTFFDPNDQHVVDVLAVTEAGFGLDHLNELEYINGYIYANVWLTNYIVKIDPKNGEVVGKIDLDDLNVKTRAKNPRSLEMNGIAYDSISDKILVTGKFWPDIYEISFPH